MIFFEKFLHLLLILILCSNGNLLSAFPREITNFIISTLVVLKLSNIVKIILLNIDHNVIDSIYVLESGMFESFRLEAIKSCDILQMYTWKGAARFWPLYDGQLA